MVHSTEERSPSVRIRTLVVSGAAVGKKTQARDKYTHRVENRGSLVTGWKKKVRTITSLSKAGCKNAGFYLPLSAEHDDEGTQALVVLSMWS